MSKEKFTLPEGFEAPEGYLIQKTADGREWIYTPTGQQLSTQRVRQLVHQHTRRLKRLAREHAPASEPSTEQPTESPGNPAHKAIQEQTAHLQETTRHALHDHAPRINGQLDEAMEHAKIDQREGVDSTGFYERHNMVAFLQWIRESLVRYTEECYAEILQDLDVIAQHVKEPTPFLSEMPPLLRECAGVTGGIDEFYRELLHFTSMQHSPHWWFERANAEFSKLCTHVQNLQRTMNGIRSRLSLDEGMSRRMNGTILLTNLAIAGKEKLSVRQPRNMTSFSHEDALATILREALKYKTPRIERANALKEQLHEMLSRLEMERTNSANSYEDISVEELMKIEQEREPTEEEMKQAEERFDAEMRRCNENISNYIFARKKAIFDILKEKPSTSARKGKEDLANAEKMLNKQVLRQLEALVNEYVTTHPAPEPYGYGSVLEEIAEAFDTVGKRYGKNYATSIVLPERKAKDNQSENSGAPQ